MFRGLQGIVALRLLSNIKGISAAYSLQGKFTTDLFHSQGSSIVCSFNLRSTPKAPCLAEEEALNASASSCAVQWPLNQGAAVARTSGCD
ncbi:hypothetical protein FN846DRAFT_577748 [Sphaerosporella brunnea]|uniref:Uncharacterized protein n=1 Tax=Sphaerosporella brunnea TaxID=1250544 RepID=A0A5J5EE77_9PEZI|nr:hypothetical protein FN846DRAFT_577748 [Sphaerosporella brunnea]